MMLRDCIGCPNKHGNSVTNSISSLLWISIVIPDFKSHIIIMSARVYFMKRVNGCKDVSIIYPQDKQWRPGFGNVMCVCLHQKRFSIFFWWIFIFLLTKWKITLYKKHNALTFKKESTWNMALTTKTKKLKFSVFFYHQTINLNQYFTFLFK